MKKLILLFSLMFFFSCSSTLQDHNQTEIENARNFWKGKTEQDLIRNWGPPNGKTSDGADGRIYIYKRNNGYITWVTNFYINQDDIIYHLNAHSE